MYFGDVIEPHGIMGQQLCSQTRCGFINMFSNIHHLHSSLADVSSDVSPGSYSNT